MKLNYLKKRFLLGRHKASIDVFNETLKYAPADWVGLAFIRVLVPLF